MTAPPLINRSMLFARDRIYAPVEWAWIKLWWLVGFILPRGGCAPLAHRDLRIA